MVKNIIIGLSCLVFVNWLFNVSKASKLQKRIAEEKQITIELINKITEQERAIDSLEIVLKQLE